MLFIQNKRKMSELQYIVVEYRRRQAQDAFLPDEALLSTWSTKRSTTSTRKKVSPSSCSRPTAGATWRRSSARATAATPTTLSVRHNTTIGKTTTRLNLPNGKWSGVTINVSGTPGDDQMKIDVKISQ